MIESILLATDGSGPAKRAAEFAADLASRFGARVTLLHAFPSVPNYLGEPNYGQAVHEILSRAEALVEEAAQLLAELGTSQVETAVLPGPAAEAILEVAATRKPDLLVMGARGLGTWQGVILGSVSLAVTQRAECPVLIVK
jgi:nucleotide-binding universal stress UspA family protein